MTSGSPIRVLIVDDVPESRESIQRLLSFEPDIHVVGQASRAQEAVELTARLQPTVVLMDTTLPDMDGLQATLTLTAQFPGVAVIILSVESDPELLRQAMVAGAREFLVKPFRFEELVAAIRRVALFARPASPPSPTVTAQPTHTKATPQADQQSRVIAVVGMKGGVGRTFLASNLAVTLARLGRRVILVDADLMFGDVAVLFNVPKGKTWTDVAHLSGMLDPEVVQDLLTVHASGVHLLLAPYTPQEAETISVDHIQQVLPFIRQLADVVLLDTYPSYSEITLAVMDAADTLLYVLTPEMTAIKDARQFLDVIELLGYTEKRVLFALNRVHPAAGITAADIEESLKQSCLVRFPDDAGPVLRSINEGMLFVDRYPEHRISEEFQRLATILFEGESTHISAESQGRRRRLFGGLILSRRATS